MTRSREPCPTCGTWRCQDCSWERVRANKRDWDHGCYRCGSHRGMMLPIFHDQRRHDDHVVDLAYANVKAIREAAKEAFSPVMLEEAQKAYTYTPEVSLPFERLFFAAWLLDVERIATEVLTGDLSLTAMRDALAVVDQIRSAGLCREFVATLRATDLLTEGLA